MIILVFSQPFLLIHCQCGCVRTMTGALSFSRPYCLATTPELNWCVVVVVVVYPPKSIGCLTFTDVEQQTLCLWLWIIADVNATNSGVVDTLHKGSLHVCDWLMYSVKRRRLNTQPWRTVVSHVRLIVCLAVKAKWVLFVWVQWIFAECGTQARSIYVFKFSVSVLSNAAL